MGISSHCLRLLSSRKLTLSTAESCTGGMVASGMVYHAGASDVFGAGFVTYSNEAKMRDLGVPSKILDTYGAVSPECAASMAKGARRRSGSDVSLSTTGYAGPKIEGSNDPVGLVYIACAFGHRIVVRKFRFQGDRYTVRRKATRQAYILLRDVLLRESEFHK